MKHKILKYCNLFNILILNLFATGFILNFVSFTQTNWIKNDNYVYGLFQYCTANQIIKLEAADSFSFYDQVEVIYRKYTSDSDDIRCFKWSKYTTPAFVSLSYITQLVALASHLSLIVVIIILKIVNHKLMSCYKKRYKDKTFKNIKESCCFKVSYHIAWNFFFCIMSTAITVLYCVNLVLFQYHQNLTNIKINNESLSWCYWLSVSGACITFVSTCALFVYTIYFKMLNNGENRKFKYSLRYFIDAYKKCNSPFYSINFDNEQFGSPVKPRGSYVSRGDSSNEPEMKATRTTGTETNGNDEKIYDNTEDNKNNDKNKNNNVFFRRNPELEDDLKDNEGQITHKSEIIDPNKSFNSDEPNNNNNNNDKEESKQSPSSSTQQPSSFIYSQVYPCGKREKNTKDAAPLKMVVLPYGSLSGTCATGSSNNNNNSETQQQEKEEKLPEVREKKI